jgi:tRNA(Ile)-lysidine synthase
MAGTRRLTQLVDEISGSVSLPDGDLVVALSGGADSAALAFLVDALGRDRRALHVDHGLTHSALMREAATEVARTVGVSLTVVETVVPPGPSPEGRARSARYEAIAAAVPAREIVLTAHTADDNVETVLINLTRGSGARGLAGIPPFRPPNIHRPLLDVDRSRLRELALLAGLPFVDDPMNLDPGLTRNRIRSLLIPRLRELNPHLGTAVGRMTSALRADADYLDSLAAGAEPVYTAGSVSIPVGVVSALPPPVANRVLMAMLEHVLGSPGITRERVTLLHEVASGQAQTRQLAGGVGVWRRDANLVLGTLGVEGTDSALDLTPGTHRWGRLVFEVAAREEVCRVAPLSMWRAIFPLDTTLTVDTHGVVHADDEVAWAPGSARHPVAWYRPGEVGYLSVLAREEV